ncbi:MAG: ubiquitin-like domain-containing protein [Candidatus Microsaccharimonas sp.]
MKRLLRRPTTYISVSILAVMLFMFGAFVVNQQVSASNESGRLITIYDRGQEKLILSNATTIAEALTDAGFTLDSKDAVEPALDEKLVASEYSVNIYRARPVMIVDGATRQKVITPYQSATQIVKDAGITLYTEDTTNVTRSDNIVGNGAGLELTIDRAIPMVLDMYGSRIDIRTQATTVGDMLKEKSIALESNDRASVGFNTPITAGMEVKLWREGKQTITFEESVPFETKKIQDADQKVGYREVQTAGQTGMRTATYEIDIQNGVEVSRVEIASIVTTQPVRQIEVVGIKVGLSISYSADKAAIMAAAGIAPSDQDYAAYIINNENALWCPIRWQGTAGCGAEYYEKFPGAESSDQVGYGLCQATPGIKMASAGADWRTNAVTQMKWCHSYALGRYGSWEAAYQAKVAKGWW